MENGIDLLLENEELEVEVQEDFLKGDKGEPGYTPVRGIDYYTEQDKQELIDELTEDIQSVKADFNTNVATKTTEFNANAINKTTEFNNNVTNKTTEFNANTITKINEYNENAEDLINRVIEAEAENERLRQDLNGLPTGQAEGKTIDITDSAEMRFSKLNINGNSKQDTREGYNLLNSNTLIGKTVSEVASNDSNIAVHMTEYNLKANIEYAFVLEVDNSEVKTNFILSFKDASNATVKNITSSNSGTTFSLTEDELNNSSYCYLYWNKSGDFGSKIITKLMIVESVNISKDYEQYGASPSPDYPSEVESNGDNVNLIDLDNMVSGYVSSSGSFANHLNQGEKRSDFIKVSPNTSYTFKIHETSQKNNDWIGIGEYSSNDVSTFIQRDVKGGSSTSFTEGLEYTITTSPTTQYIVVSSRNLAGATKIKLEEGSTPTPYSPYGQGCINEVISNKNLFEINETNWELTSEGIKNKAQNAGISIGECKVKRGQTVNLNLKLLSKPTVDTTFSGYIDGIGDTNLQFLGIQQSSYVLNTVYTRTYIATEDCTISYKLWGNANSDIFELQFWAEIDNITTYIPHQSQTYTIPTQQPMRAIGDIRDTFVKKNNKWYERHNIARIIFDGTESTWGYADLEGAWINITDLLPRCNVISNYYKNYNTSSELIKHDYGISVPYNLARLYVRNMDYDNISDFKSYLQEQYEAGTPVYVDYLLATPIDIECTPEQVAILDEIDNTVKTYKGVTHILSTDNVEPYVKVTYKKDIETLFNALAGSGV